MNILKKPEQAFVPVNQPSNFPRFYLIPDTTPRQQRPHISPMLPYPLQAPTRNPAPKILTPRNGNSPGNLHRCLDSTQASRPRCSPLFCPVDHIAAVRGLCSVGSSRQSSGATPVTCPAVGPLRPKWQQEGSTRRVLAHGRYPGKGSTYSPRVRPSGYIPGQLPPVGPILFPHLSVYRPASSKPPS